MVAVACRAEPADDSLGVADPEHAAVDDVRDLYLAAREQESIVRVAQVSRRAALRAVVAVLPDDSGSTCERDQGDGFGELLVDADVTAVRRDERVIRLGENSRDAGSARREPPDDPLGGADHDHAVVVAVGDHQVAGQGPSIQDGREPQTGQDRISSHWRLTRPDGRRAARRPRRGSGRCLLAASGREHGQQHQHTGPPQLQDASTSTASALPEDCDHPDCTPGSDGSIARTCEAAARRW